MKQATIRIQFVVSFLDNGEDDLRDQAIEAAMEDVGFSPQDFDLFEIVGDVEEARLNQAQGRGR